MRLHLIVELKFSKAIERMAPLLATMPRGKAKHSIRAAKNVHKAGGGKRAVYTTILHDFIERGGDINHLSDHIEELGLPKDIVLAVHSLSSDEKTESNTLENEPLLHLQSILPAINEKEIRDIIIIAKMGDRIDNLKKRIRKFGKIGKNYKRKSIELLDFLVSNYTGKAKLFDRLQQKFMELINHV